jgi:hypothetical protein
MAVNFAYRDIGKLAAVPVGYAVDKQYKLRGEKIWLTLRATRLGVKGKSRVQISMSILGGSTPDCAVGI